MNVYAGTAVTVTATFSVANGTITDPTAILVVIKGGSTPAVTWVYGGAGSITRVNTGVYAVALDTTPGTIGTPGPWTVEFIGTGACAAVNVIGFTVEERPI